MYAASGPLRSGWTTAVEERMLKLIDGLPGNVIGFEAVGKVEADDYKTVLDPAIDAAVAAHGSVRLLYVLGAQYDGFTAGAMWQDSRLGLTDREHFERVALVSDHEHLVNTIGHFGWMFPGELRTYALAQLDEAKAWVAVGGTA
jgi:hypothetical protein